MLEREGLDLSSHGGRGTQIGKNEPDLGRRREKRREEGHDVFWPKAKLVAMMVEAGARRPGLFIGWQGRFWRGRDIFRGASDSFFPHMCSSSKSVRNSVLLYALG